jgi:hypothetical protein
MLVAIIHGKWLRAFIKERVERCDALQIRCIYDGWHARGDVRARRVAHSNGSSHSLRVVSKYGASEI